MSDTNLSEAPADSGQQATEPPATSQEALTPRDAGRLLASLRRPRAEAEPQPEQRQQQAAPVNESPAQAEDAAVVEEQPPGETQEADPAQQPPIEPPRSWTKEDKELFAGLPRETQERLAERERSRDTDFSRRQNEAAEKLKGLTAQQQQVEQARTQYESALPLLLQQMQAAQAGEFSDIKTLEDVDRLSKEDWPRYAQWDFAQKKIAVVQQQLQEAQIRQFSENNQRFAQFANEQDRLLAEKAPEMADPIKAADLQKKVVSALEATGFDKAELAQAWNGQSNFSIRDHRVQMVIRDAALWRDAQAKSAEVTKKPVPQVQRPGTQRAVGADRVAETQRLETQLDSGKLTVKQQLEVAARLRSLKAPFMPRKAN